MRLAAQQKRTLGESLPAPIKGIDTRQVLGLMDPETCLFTYNLMPTDQGCEVRQGYAEYGNGSTGADPYTLIPFNGLSEDGTDDKLFLCDRAGIWDATDKDDTSPTKVHTWASTAAGAGICSYIQHVDTNGAMFLLVCDKVNGYHTYTQSSGAWAKIAQGSGGTQIASPANPANFAYVMKWKENVWFIEKDSQTAWYLDVLLIYGTPTKFEFGNKHPNGGFLASLHSFTHDSGHGEDDFLVALSSSGDVSMWWATDLSTNMGMRGLWFVGEVPTVGRRCGLEYGGDVYILSINGVVSMSSLIKGQTVDNQRNLLTDKIAPQVRAVMAQGRATFGWGLVVNAADRTLIITTPAVSSYDRIQFVLNLTTQAWGIWRDVPIEHGCMFRNTFYFCKTVDSENRLYYLTGYVDDVRISSSDPGSLAINWSVLGAFSNFGAPSIQKKAEFLRPVFTSGSYPNVAISPKYDFDVQELTTVPAVTDSTASLWGAGKWNQSIWSGTTTSAVTPTGGAGMGRYVGYAMRGSSASPVKFIAVDMMIQGGGLM